MSFGLVLTSELLEKEKTDKEKQALSYHDDVMEVLSADQIKKYLKYVCGIPS